MMNLNEETMREVIQEAFDRTDSLRWQMAITRAAEEFVLKPVHALRRARAHHPLGVERSLYR